jgi:hypothetical protein
MTTFMVGLRLDGDSAEEVLQRVQEWRLRPPEGVVMVNPVPDPVEVPSELQAGMPGMLPPQPAPTET